jgi:hypothetical protein
MADEIKKDDVAEEKIPSMDDFKEELEARINNNTLPMFKTLREEGKEPRECVVYYPHIEDMEEKEYYFDLPCLKPGPLFED